MAIWKSFSRHLTGHTHAPSSLSTIWVTPSCNSPHRRRAVSMPTTAHALALCLFACSKSPDNEARAIPSQAVAPPAKSASNDPPPVPAERVLTPTLTPLKLPPSDSALGPRFATGTRAPALTWIEEATAASSARIMLSTYSERGWAPPSSMVEEPRLLANWADVPAAHQLPSGQWLLAYPQHHRESGRDYGLVIAHFDRDLKRLDRWIPDGVTRGPETGFVDFVGAANGATLVWLDGRQMRSRDTQPPSAPQRTEPSHAGAHASHGDETMSLRALRVDDQGRPVGVSTVVDSRTCECCKLDGAMGADGPWVVYRDREIDERRDIRAASMRPVPAMNAGSDQGLVVTASRDVHRDAWMMPGCPVNGPALARSRDGMFVAWFSAADGARRVSIARSDAASVAFAEAHRVDLGAPVGRVDLVALEAGDLLVTWIETDREHAGRGRLLSRLVSPSGSVGPPIHIHNIGIGRDWGFPRAHEYGGELMWIWTNAKGPHTSLEGVRTSTDSLRKLARARGFVSPTR